MIFGPFIFQLFAPIFVLVPLLVTHINESRGQSAGKRYIFIPATIVAIASFFTAQSVLSIWVFIISFLIWTSVIGHFLTFLTVFFFGLAPLAIITAPFIIWYQAGFAEFLGIIVFFLIATFWYGFSSMAFSEDQWKTAPETFLGYSPHASLLGALSFQVIALPLYYFNWSGLGNFISDVGGGFFLFLAFISAIKWRSIKKKLSKEERESLHQPSAWIYFFGFIITNLLYTEFQQKFSAPTAVLFWLNGFFLIALVSRFFGIFKRNQSSNEKSAERLKIIPPTLEVAKNEKKYCHNCGEKIEKSGNFCTSCGAALKG